MYVFHLIQLVYVFFVLILTKTSEVSSQTQLKLKINKQNIANIKVSLIVVLLWIFVDKLFNKTKHNH